MQQSLTVLLCGLFAAACTATPVSTPTAPSHPAQASVSAPSASANPMPHPDAGLQSLDLPDVTLDLGPCAHVSQHQYEVCSAYYYASGWRLADYRFGRSVVVGRLIAHEVKSRYWGTAYTALQNQTANWPSHVETTVPSIRITGVHVDETHNVATLHTIESWIVQKENGPVLFQEKSQSHTITLRRVPSILLHKWVVSKIR